MNEIVERVLARLNGFDGEKLDAIKQALYIVLNDYSFGRKATDLAPIHSDIKTKAVQMFFVSKKVEGCTDRTLTYYRGVLSRFFKEVTHPIEEITADDVRFYIATRAMRDNISKTSQDNELRVLKSFFNWCSDEGYIGRVPTHNVNPIKKEKRIKKPFTEIEIELLRQNAKNKRDLAILDVLYSTGVRVSELCNMSLNDIENDEITVLGKGEKERIVYLNAKAMLSLKQYLKERTDDNEAVFVTSKSPYTRLNKGGVEVMLRDLGKRAGVKNTHPHRFRRTAATLALNRGMPIEQVSQMLGHEKIETTTIYARSDKDNVKASHRKYVV